MNDLPRHEPTPLYAESGRFERTLRRARRRRARAAGLTMVAVLAICTGGAIALVTTNSPQSKQAAEVPSTLPASVTGHSPQPSSGPNPAPSQHTGSEPGSPLTSGSAGSSASSSPAGSGDSQGHSNTPPTGPTSASEGTGGDSGHPGATKSYHGVAVDHRGKPLADVSVYVVPPDGKPQQVDKTAPDGTFQVPCTGQPVLLATRDFGPAGSDTSTPEAGYTYVGNDQQAPDCEAKPAAAKTVMPEAGTLNLTVTDSSGAPVPDSNQPQLYCEAVTTESCYQPLTDADGQYTFTGLTAGDYTLRSGDVSRTYTVSAGQSTDVQWTLPDPSTPTSSATSPSEPPDSSGSTTDSSASTGTSTSESPVK